MTDMLAANGKCIEHLLHLGSIDISMEDMYAGESGDDVVPGNAFDIVLGERNAECAN